jgi:phosphoglycolate phosphatase/putative hydrolase of the HAD superfamily
VLVTGSPIRLDQLKVVVFDVDGTLYRQGPLRRAMFLELLRFSAVRPLEGLRTFRVLQAYRQAQEDLRAAAGSDIASAQIRIACERTGLDAAAVSACIERWMEQAPLPKLLACRQSGLVEFLEACKASGLRLAALSDYPADAKLRALGIADRFELALCAQSPEIGVFKPNPRGLEVTLERMGVDRHECLYVGDRAEVDAAAAEAAGIACAILTHEPPEASDTHAAFESYPHLQELLFSACHGACRDVITVES